MTRTGNMLQAFNWIREVVQETPSFGPVLVDAETLAYLSRYSSSDVYQSTIGHARCYVIHGVAFLPRETPVPQAERFQDCIDADVAARERARMTAMIANRKTLKGRILSLLYRLIEWLEPNGPGTPV